VIGISTKEKIKKENKRIEEKTLHGLKKVLKKVKMTDSAFDG